MLNKYLTQNIFVLAIFILNYADCSRVYISALNSLQLLSPAKIVPFFTLNPSDLIFKGPRGRLLTSPEMKDVKTIQLSSFKSVNELFLGWKKALLVGIRDKIDASKLNTSIGLFSNSLSKEECEAAGNGGKPCREHDWPLWNANKDNIIYQGLKKILRDKRNKAILTELLKNKDPVHFGLLHDEGAIPHWGIGNATEKQAKKGQMVLHWNAVNTYGHILKEMQSIFKKSEKDRKFHAFYVGPKTGDDDMMLWDTSFSLGLQP